MEQNNLDVLVIDLLLVLLLDLGLELRMGVMDPSPHLTILFRALMIILHRPLMSLHLAANRRLLGRRGHNGPLAAVGSTVHLPIGLDHSAGAVLLRVGRGIGD